MTHKLILNIPNIPWFLNQRNYEYLLTSPGFLLLKHMEISKPVQRT